MTRPWSSTRDWVERADLRDADVTWRCDQEGNWTVDQSPDDPTRLHRRDLYSLRTAGSPSFPFAALAGMLARAERVLDEAIDHPWAYDLAVQALLRRIVEDADLSAAPDLGRALRAAGCDHPVILGALTAGADPARASWVVELLARLDRGTFVKRCFGASPLASARTFELSMHLDVRGRPGLGRAVAREIDQELRGHGLGRAEAGGATMRKDEATGEFVIETEFVDIVVRDDLDQGAAVIREVLRRHGAPSGTRLVHAGRPDAEIPLT